MTERVLAVSAHPDDETLGAGGALLAHCAKGDRVSWLIVTKAHGERWDPGIIAAKEAEVGAVAAAYQVDQLFWPALPATRLDSLPLEDVIEAVREAIVAVRPQLVYVVHGGDIHTDHRVVSLAVNAVIKPFAMSKLGVRRVLAYESLSSTDAIPPDPSRAFLPTVWQDIGRYLERKLQVMSLYETELQAEHLPRTASTLRALARIRGATVGVEYAEAFALVREIG